MLRILHLRVLNLPEDGSNFVSARSLLKTTKLCNRNDCIAFVFGRGRTGYTMRSIFSSYFTNVF